MLLITITATLCSVSLVSTRCVTLNYCYIANRILRAQKFSVRTWSNFEPLISRQWMEIFRNGKMSYFVDQSLKNTLLKFQPVPTFYLLSASEHENGHKYGKFEPLYLGNG